MKTNDILFAIIFIAFITFSCNSEKHKKPVGVQFHKETLKRLGGSGDNWRLTWLSDDSQITLMCDGNWLAKEYRVWWESFHNHAYRVLGGPDDFAREDIPGFPEFLGPYAGWFGYGIIAVNEDIFVLTSRSGNDDFGGPFRGLKMLKSSDNGNTWYRINSKGEERYIEPLDSIARDDISESEMFFFEEDGRVNHGVEGYPFSFVSFVQNGKNNAAAKDDYIYIHSPEGSQAHQLLLARVKNNEIEYRDKWEFFKSWKDNIPEWTSDLQERGVLMEYPVKNDSNEYFGWYSWLPSVVWNKDLDLYIMVNGGTYAGVGFSTNKEDYYDNWMHTKSGSLGFWYSENPYGPWTQFYYTDYWTVDDERNRTYQPELSPKWISEDGTKMILIWSDAGLNDAGESHSDNYLWNQMQITLDLE